MILLTIIVPPVMEEALVDWLLTQSDITGFTSHNSSGHGSSHKLSLLEQVTGRRHQITFWIELEKKKAELILTELKQNFSGCSLHYWMVPLLDSGTI